METKPMKTRFVLIKARVPDWYEGADCAVVEVTEDLVLLLDKRIAMTKKLMGEDSFYGTRWWDCSPYFVSSAGPETFGLEMSEEDFENQLDSNNCIVLPEGYEPDEYASIDTLIMTISAVTAHSKNFVAGWQWSGYDKHIGDSGRVTTSEVAESALDEWAELIGCTEMLDQVRRCRGVE